MRIILLKFSDWCDFSDEVCGSNELRIINARAADVGLVEDALVKVVPDHYAGPERIATILERLGRPQSAAFIEGMLPTTKSIRSGDLGEILATEYVESQTPFSVPIKRLRWKDHRNMAMRGDDVIGLLRDSATGNLLFLKGEAKSRASLAAGVVAEARSGLDKDDGLPSAHALTFISSRLSDAGNKILANAIDDALLKYGISKHSVEHMIFTFSGNDPADYLRPAIQAYSGGYIQHYVGLRIATHRTFVTDVYTSVIANAYND